MQVPESNLQNSLLFVASSLTDCTLFLSSGTTSVHAELEECVAKYVGKPAAIVTGMGYATNSAIIPVLIGKVWLLLLFIF